MTVRRRHKSRGCGNGRDHVSDVVVLPPITERGGRRLRSPRRRVVWRRGTRSVSSWLRRYQCNMIGDRAQIGTDAGAARVDDDVAARRRARQREDAAGIEIRRAKADCAGKGRSVAHRHRVGRHNRADGDRVRHLRCVRSYSDHRSWWRRRWCWRWRRWCWRWRRRRCWRRRWRWGRAGCGYRGALRNDIKTVVDEKPDLILPCRHRHHEMNGTGSNSARCRG